MAERGRKRGRRMKPCPFCGSGAIFSGGGEWAQYKCRKPMLCGTEGPIAWRRNPEDTASSLRKKAKDMWNGRVNEEG